MSGRMNWDRVRKENLVHLHGSEWVSPVANASLANDKKKTNKKKRLRLRKSVPPAALMVGCTCGKTIGFMGAHKKRCPLCRTQVLIASAKQVAVIGRSDEGGPARESIRRDASTCDQSVRKEFGNEIGMPKVRVFLASVKD